MFDLHRHDHFSTFDGMGNPMELARIAKELGYTSLGTSNHGNTNGLIEHYVACQAVEIKPILGVEAYYQPVFDKEKPKYHLCLFAKNVKGYENINRIMTMGNLEKKYYKPVCDNESLKEFHEGIICTSACIGSYFSQCIVKNKIGNALKAMTSFKKLFGDDFYIEIQPYKLSESGLQERVNETLISLASKLDIKCIFTSDSHFGRKEDFDTYLKLHEFKKSEYGKHYSQRYMPTEEQYIRRFQRMHGATYGESNALKMAKDMLKALDEIEEKIEIDIIGQLNLELPKVAGDSGDSSDLLWTNIKAGLKERGKYNKEYVKRCKEEYEVIVEHGFCDYFLIVQDYTKFAKDSGIEVGPGRGSVCNCQVAYALGITDVDAIYFGLDFTRFLRMDKKKLPDIDLDFETSRRQEVIDYIVEKYPGQAVQICSYGLYKVDNLLNDLFKVCGVSEKDDQTEIKKFVKSFVVDYVYEEHVARKSKKYAYYNDVFDNILKHFGKLYKSLRYIGTHAAGVAITGGDILQHCAIESRGEKVSSAYDLNNLEIAKAIKFDILGLNNLSILKELRKLTGESFQDEWLEDPEMFKLFREGKTEGIFQFESTTAKAILMNIQTDCADDVIAANALNRPGPLTLKMPENYAANKQNINEAKESIWYPYTKDTYGTVIYQEQITAICRGIGKMDWAMSDKMLKIMKGKENTEASVKARDENESMLRDAFVAGAKKDGISNKEANKIFDSLTVYSFNKGHATGYALVAMQQMWYKAHYPEMFWYITMKYCNDDKGSIRANAVLGGNILLLPHVNGKPMVSLTKYDGSTVIQEGLLSVKNCGEKAAETIYKERRRNGDYISRDDFLDRVNRSVVNKRVVDALTENGALEFDKAIYESRVEKYNSSMYMKAH